MKSGVGDKRLLRLPIYSAQAGGKFGAVFLMMQYTRTADAVTGTAFFCARTVYVIMWTGRNVMVYSFTSGSHCVLFTTRVRMSFMSLKLRLMC